MDIKKRNKEVKKILSKHFDKVSVTGGRGTATGWINIEITSADPCPYKQDALACNEYCTNGICDGNDKMIHGSWGNTVKQIRTSEIQKIVEEKIKDVEMYTFCSDDNNNTELSCCNVSVNFTH